MARRPCELIGQRVLYTSDVAGRAIHLAADVIAVHVTGDGNAAGGVDLRVLQPDGSTTFARNVIEWDSDERPEGDLERPTEQMVHTFRPIIPLTSR